MADVENIVNNDEFFGDIVDTLKEGIEQHRKRECLKSVIANGKAYLLGRKWTQEKVNKASNETINETYEAYKGHELNEKGEKTRKALGKHVIPSGFLGLLKSGIIKHYSKILRMSRSSKIRWLT